MSSFLRYFRGKKIWVTGASSGIGFAFVCAIAEASPAAIVISGRDVARLQQLAARVTGCPVLVLPFDVTEHAAYSGCVEQMRAFCGGIDIAFLNAGGSEHVSCEHFDARVYERAMQLNYFSLIYGIEAVLPLLRESACGHLVGMSSMASFLAAPRAEAYAAAKGAARLCLEGLRAQLWQEGICVTTVCPGFVATPLTAKNKFRMPFVMSAAKSACIITRGVAKRRAEIIFPRRMFWLTWCVKWLPLSWYARLMARLL